MHYIREVASGSRSNLKLENILSFATGKPVEPVSGYILQPAISFVTSAEYIVDKNCDESTVSTYEVNSELIYNIWRKFVVFHCK